MQKKRAAYAAFEKAVLDLYDQGFLTLALLDQLADRYCQMKIDSAGSQSLLTRDGKALPQVCIELVDPTFQTSGRGSSDDHGEYWERELRKWEDIVYWRWRWSSYNSPFTARTTYNDIR